MARPKKLVEQDEAKTVAGEDVIPAAKEYPVKEVKEVKKVHPKYSKFIKSIGEKHD